ncbi:hypothetical protein BDV06DRAFT_209964 [Aspergillus oleicola]
MDVKAEAKRTGTEARLRARRDEITGSNTDIASSMYCNLVVIPEEFAADFRQLCLRNPAPLPLLEQTEPGERSSTLAFDSDISTDLAKEGVSSITSEWSNQHVGFLLGCSFTFETALAAARLQPRNMTENKAPPVYTTSVQLNPSGVFAGAYMAVSMRWYRPEDLARVRSITSKLSKQHGEPVAWSWDGAKYLGIEPKLKAKDDGEIPVFWGCGVTAEVALCAAKLPGFSMSHFPGAMFVTDLTGQEVEEDSSIP